MASYGKFLREPRKLIESLWDHAEPAVGRLEPAAPVQGGVAQEQAANVAHTVQAKTGIVADSVSSPSGLCGWIPSDVGEPTWVCEAFGQVMPGVVFLVSLFVFFGTIAFLFHYCRRSFKAAGQLKSLADELSRIEAPQVKAYSESENAMRISNVLMRYSKSLPALLSLHQSIQSSMFSVDGGKSRVALSRSVTEMMEGNSDLQTWTGGRLAEHLPAWLTAIGLLTTFLAILLGLQGVHVLANMEVQGISGLVNGLSGKFFSSIVALGCALSVTMASYYWNGRVDREWEKLLRRLDLMLPALTIERAFLDLLKERTLRASV